MEEEGDKGKERERERERERGGGGGGGGGRESEGEKEGRRERERRMIQTVKNRPLSLTQCMLLHNSNVDVQTTCCIWCCAIGLKLACYAWQ